MPCIVLLLLKLGLSPLCSSSTSSGNSLPSKEAITHLNPGLDVDKQVGKKWDKGEVTAPEQDEGQPHWPEQWESHEEDKMGRSWGLAHQTKQSKYRGVPLRACLGCHLLLLRHRLFPYESAYISRGPYQGVWGVWGGWVRGVTNPQLISMQNCMRM